MYEDTERLLLVVVPGGKNNCALLPDLFGGFCYNCNASLSRAFCMFSFMTKLIIDII